MTDVALRLLMGLYGAAALGVLYTYVGYPLSLWLRTRSLNLARPAPFTPADAPRVSILMAVYNEAGIIERRVRNLLETHYPDERLDLWIGTDACTDGTDAILRQLAESEPRLRVNTFNQRLGKPAILNTLAPQTQSEILVLVDARAQFLPDTLPNLLRHFRRPEVGLASVALENFHPAVHGVAAQEKGYFGLETWLKDRESRLGILVGAFGSGYALRRELYSPTPPLCLADDFYLSMRVLEQGKLAVLDTEARCRLAVNNDIRAEFRRKRRIATGNFQNLNWLRGLWRNPLPGVRGAYLGHKVLRWLTPLFGLLMLLTSGLLAPYFPFWGVVFLLQVGTVVVALVDLPLALLGIGSGPLRYLTHFYAMNVALLAGLWRYLRGVRSGTWEPTRRAVG